MQRDELIGKLNEATLELASSGGWQSWLRARKSLHAYSLSNLLLICKQKPSATMVAGRTTWISKFNRYPKKGTAIWIWAPMRASKKERARLREAGESESRMRFRPAFVFDVADTFQLEGKPEIPLGGGLKWGDEDIAADPDLFADLCLAAENLGVAHIEHVPIHGAHANYHRVTKVIKIDPSCAGGVAVSGLAHELAHHVDFNVLDQDLVTIALPDKVRDEAIAESAAFMVCDSLGIDTAAPASNYLCAFVGSDKVEDPAAALSAIAGRVLKVTTTIEGALANVRSASGAAAAGEPAAA